MVRAPCVDKNGIKKGAWSEEEDNKLRAYIKKHGHPNWRELPKLAGLSRCGKSCRLRWMNYLKPNVKHGNFKREEEDLIIHLHNKLGNKWSKMAAELPGRSDNEIKNYWHTHLKTRIQFDQNNEQSKNLEPNTANPKSFLLKNPNFTTQQEVDILVAVLSSSSSSSSSTSSSSATTSSSTSELSPCSLGVTDSGFPGDFNMWDEGFLVDDCSFISSSDYMYSPLRVAYDVFSQNYLQDYNLMDDVPLWST